MWSGLGRWQESGEARISAFSFLPSLIPHLHLFTRPNPVNCLFPDGLFSHLPKSHKYLLIHLVY